MSAAATDESTPTRQTQDDLFVTNLITNLGHGLADVVSHDPVLAGAADLEHKSVEQCLALQRVRDFGWNCTA